MGIDTSAGVIISSVSGDADSKQNIFDHIMKLLVILVCQMGMANCYAHSLELEFSAFDVGFFVLLVSLFFYVTSFLKKKYRDIVYIVAAVLVGLYLLMTYRYFEIALQFTYSRLIGVYNSYYGLEIYAFEDVWFSSEFGSNAICIILLPMSVFLPRVVSRDKSTRWAFLIVISYLLVLFLSGNMPGLVHMLEVLIPFTSYLVMRCICVFDKNVRVNATNGVQHGLRGAVILVSSLVLVAASLLGYGFFYKGVEGFMGPIRDELYSSSITEIFERIKGGYSQGGINGGELPRNNGIKFSNKTHLYVTYSEDQNSYTYLKGYVGSVYDGDSWNELDASVYKTQSYVNLKNTCSDEEVLSIPFEIINVGKNFNSSLFSGAVANTVTVEVYDDFTSDGNYVCFPYMALVSSADGDIEDTSYLMRASDELVNYYSCYTYNTRDRLYSDFMSGCIFDVDNYKDYLKYNINAQTAFAELVDRESLYREFVYENYLEVPENCSRLYEQFKGYRSDNYSDIISTVQNELSNGFTYTLRPPKTPGGSDMIEYFFYDSREGYCTHFASAAVMMFRSMGVPARYVQGYIISPSKAGERLPVTDSAAHAWPEIYIDGFGWLPVEVTPGSDSQAGGYTPDINDVLNNDPDAMAEKTTAETTTRETTTQAPTTVEPKTTRGDDATSTASDNTAGAGTENTRPVSHETTTVSNSGSQGGSNATQSNSTEVTMEGEVSTEENIEPGQDSEEVFGAILAVLFRILIAVLVISLIVLGFAFNRSVKLRRRMQILKKKNNNDAVIGLYVDLRNISEIFGYIIDEDVDIEDLLEYYSSADEQGFTDYRRISQKAMFSESEISDDERRCVTQIYKKTVRELYDKQNFLRKFMFKFIYGIV